MKLIAGGLLLVAAVVYVLCRAARRRPRRLGLRAGRRRGVDGRRAGRLVRRHRAVPAPAGAADPAHGDHPEQEGPDRRRAGRLRPAVLPDDRDRRRAGGRGRRSRSGSASGWPTRRTPPGWPRSSASAIGGMAAVLRDDELRDSVASFADKRLRDTDIAPLLARLIDAVCDAGQHQAALTVALRGMRTFLDENRGGVPRAAGRRSRRSGCRTGSTTGCSPRASALLQTFLADVVDDRRARAAARLRHPAARAGPAAARRTPSRSRKVEAAKIELLDHPSVRDYLANLWSTLKKLVLDGVGRPGLGPAPLGRVGDRARRRGAARRPGGRRAKVDEALQRLAGHVVTHYADDLDRRHLHDRRALGHRGDRAGGWSCRSGRDLQFIRINGTVVGSLAGPGDLRAQPAALRPRRQRRRTAADDVQRGEPDQAGAEHVQRRRAAAARAGSTACSR